MIPMSFVRKWTSFISSLSCRIYFLIIILQIPLFRVPCRAGICRTPIEVTSCQLIASKLVPETAVKALLYPGAIANALFKKKAIPNFNALHKLYNFTDVKSAATAFSDLQRLEVVVGSYISVAGAIAGFILPGRTSLLGTLVVTWGLVMEIIQKKLANVYTGKGVYIYPAMYFTLLFAFLSVRKDVRKIFRSFEGWHFFKLKHF